MSRSICALAIVLGAVAQGRAGPPPRTSFIFKDASEEAGLYPHVGGIAGHGAAWGDVDGDGWADLYVGTFGDRPYGSKSNMFFRNNKGRFALDPDPALRIVGRANGAVFADFDNDGDLDLYTTNHAIKSRDPRDVHFMKPNAFFRNDGGKFTDISQESGACPIDFPARSAAVLDYDGDGLLDLAVGECFFQGGVSRSRLFRNTGKLRFENVTLKVGLPDKITGFGVAAGDVNQDGWPDLLFGGRYHGNRLFQNDGKGNYKEVPKAYADLSWEYRDTGDDTPTGVCFGDVNRDGLFDIVIGQHFDRPWYTGGVPIRLYLNRGLRAGWPRFEDVTERAGLKPLPMKAPHVEVQDFDNDGWPDLLTSIVKFANGKPYPVIFKNKGAVDGVPRFHEDALAVNDFPTAEDRRTADVGAFFARMEKEQKIVYMAAGPSGDYDRDGRLDLFLPNWWVNSRSLLLHNETPGGAWVDVGIEGGQGVNRMGIGTRVRVYEANKLGLEKALLGVREISVGYGYASGQEAFAHFGLGEFTACDIEIIPPHGKGKPIEVRRVKANQRVVISLQDGKVQPTREKP